MTTEKLLLQANRSLMEINERQSRQIAELTAEVKKMSAQIAWFQQHMFGRRSEERLPADNLPSLFDASDMEMMFWQPTATITSIHGYILTPS